MNGGEQISHVTYKSIKRMNRTELSEFCQKLYAEGRNSVKAADDGIEADDVYKVIAGVRGIGPSGWRQSNKPLIRRLIKRKDDSYDHTHLLRHSRSA